MGAIDRSACTARRHGDRSAYSWWGCRCPDAREDWRLYKKRLRESRQPSAYIDSTGTARRIQALVAIGYCFADLAAQTPWGRRHVGALARQEDPACLVRTATVIRELYDRLSGTPGTSSYAHRVAERYDWVSPLAWEGVDIDDPAARPDLGGAGDDIVDDEAIRRVLTGALPFGKLRPAERVEAYRQLAGAGATPAMIRRRLNINGPTLRQLVALAEQAAAEPSGAAA